MATRLAATLATCAAWAIDPRPSGEPRVLRRLPGGESNESWLVAWGDARLVLRLDGLDPAAPGLDRAEEVALQGAAAAAGLAPQPRFGGADFLVSDYVGDPGSKHVSDDGEGPDPADPAARARLLRAIHSLQVPARRGRPGLRRSAWSARSAGPGAAAGARRLPGGLRGACRQGSPGAAGPGQGALRRTRGPG